MLLEDLYNKVCSTPSDIYLHLPLLKKFSSECEHVTEFGTRNGVSTTAILAAQPKKFVTYDIDPDSVRKVTDLLMPVKGETDFQILQGDTLKIDIEPTEFLFIDSLHTYNHLKQELARHAHKVSKFIGFHDTESFGSRGEDGMAPGLKTAIYEFLDQSPRWHIQHADSMNNGLIILKML